LLADAGEQGMATQTRAGLEAVREDCRRMQAGLAVVAVEAALSV
jgi:hypothetical protein